MDICCCCLDEAEYNYESKNYCGECLLDVLEQTQKIKVFSNKVYMHKEKFIGCSDSNGYSEILDDLLEDLSIKEIL